MAHIRLQISVNTVDTAVSAMAVAGLMRVPRNP
jgi:hypothetical protein